MKHSVKVIALAVLINSCAQQEKHDGYTLTVTIEGIKSGQAKLKRFNEVDRTSTTTDSVDFTEGKFTLKGKLPAPEMITLMIEPGNWSLQVFLENGNITVKADTTGSEHYDWTSFGGIKGANIKKYTVEGSANHDSWTKFENDPTLKSYITRFADIDKAYTAAKDNEEEKNKIKAQADSLHGVYMNLRRNYIETFIDDSPSAAAGPYMLNQHYLLNQDFPLNSMETLVGKFTEPAKSTVYYKLLAGTIKKRQDLLPGHTAPDFTLYKPDSSSLTLSSLRGKYVMLDFWASWCVPCREAIPHWKEVYKKYQPKGFEVLSITNDFKWSDWKKALEEEKMPWLQVADEFPIKNMTARVFDLYMTPYLPTYILLDKEGKVVLYNPSEQEMDEKLKEIFGS